MSCLIKVTVIVSWFYAMIWSILPFFGPHQYVTEGFQTSCTFDYISQDYYTRSILMIMTVFGFIIPVIIITISYSMITKSIQKHYNSLNMRILDTNIITSLETNDEECLSLNLRTYNKYSSNNSSSVPPLSLKNDWHMQVNESTNFCIKKDAVNITLIERKQAKVNRKSSKHTLKKDQWKSEDLKRRKLFFKKEIQVTKFTILIIISFCASWLPYTILAVIGQFSPNRETIVTPYTAYGATLFAKCSTLFNPILYLILKQRCK
jgi:hypothetical protein